MKDVLQRYSEALDQADTSTYVGKAKIQTLLGLAKRYKEFREIAEQHGYSV